jgi:glycosyltransferase involved in cell wall biosynthesis
MKPTVILVGAKPTIDSSQHPGGQMTASLGLLSYTHERSDLELAIIDTTQSSFPVPSFSTRLKKGISRVREFISLVREKRVVGMIIFSSSGFSFYERILLALTARCVRVRTLLFVRSGHFIDEVEGSKLKRLLATLLLRVPNYLGAQGESWRVFYLRLGATRDKIALIPNWLPPDKHIASKPKALRERMSIRFLFVGWLVEKKGVFELLEAASALHKDGCNFELYIAGGGTLEQYAIEYVSSHGLGEKVRVLGWQTPDQIDELLSQCHVFVLPSKAEGFPNAMLEAMAAGLPAIVSDVGAVRDSLFDGENGFLLKEPCAHIVEVAMRKYLSKPSLVEMHSKKTLEVVRDNHDWQRNCELLFSYFEPSQTKK